MTFNEIMNSPVLYELMIAGTVYILIFCMITFRKAYKHRMGIGLSKKKMRTMITSSAIYSVVPSVSIVIGLFGLAVVLGVPRSWFQFLVIGAVTYELIASDTVATGTGYESVAAPNTAEDPSIIDTVMFVISICILSGIVGILIFGKKVRSGLQTARKKNGQTEALVTGMLSLAIIEALLPFQMMKGPVYLAVVLASYLIVLIQMQAVKRFRLAWLRNFVIANTLLLGMVSSLVWERIL